MNPPAAARTSMTEPTIKNEECQPMIVDGEGLLNMSEQLGGENIKECVHPPTLGGIFLTGKPKSSVKDIDKVRLNAIDGQNNNRKRRPWIIVEELPGGEVRVMSSTTQWSRGWDAVAKEHQQYFLPISPTISNGRPVLEVREDFDGSFVGKSLLYLCIEVVIHASVLNGERCVGYLEESAVEIIRRERDLILEAERAARAQRMREGGWPRNTDRRQRNRADSGNHFDRGFNGQGFFDDPTRQSQEPPFQNFSQRTCTIGRSSDPSLIDPAGRANAQEHLRHDQSHCQTRERTNKNGGQKRRERAARKEPSRQGQ